MSKRKSISKKTRFEVFKRDLFCCQYCGAAPPAAILEVDHIKPVCAGGSNDINNLVVACFECNRGKGGNTLEVSPETIAQKAEVIAEKRDQLKAYEKLLSSQKAVMTRKANKIEKVFEGYFDCQFTDKFMLSIKMFLSRLPYTIVEDAMEIACSKMGSPEPVVKYFCGICWARIREIEDA